MKRAIIVTMMLILASSAAFADVIGIYSDATGTSCSLAPGFSTTATVIHTFTAGATGSRFSIELPAGSSFFSFNSTLPCISVPVTSPDGITLTYCGECLTPTIVLGTITGILAPGVVRIVPASGAEVTAIVTDCAFVEHIAAGGVAYVGGTGECVVATEQSTWGAVKSLYR